MGGGGIDIPLEVSAQLALQEEGRRLGSFLNSTDHENGVKSDPEMLQRTEKSSQVAIELLWITWFDGKEGKTRRAAYLDFQFLWGGEGKDYNIHCDAVMNTLSEILGTDFI